MSKYKFNINVFLTIVELIIVLAYSFLYFIFFVRNAFEHFRYYRIDTYFEIVFILFTFTGLVLFINYLEKVLVKSARTRSASLNMYKVFGTTLLAFTLLSIFIQDLFLSDVLGSNMSFADYKKFCIYCIVRFLVFWGLFRLNKSSINF